MNASTTLVLSNNTIQRLLSLVAGQSVIGFGAGRTACAALTGMGPHLPVECEAIVVASQETAVCAKTATRIPVVDLNAVEHLPMYIDGADYINPFGFLLKGRGGAIACEKVLASYAEHFVCVVRAMDQKCVQQLRHHPVVIEVFPWARSVVSHALVKQFNALPRYRHGTLTVHGNILLDVFELDFSDPVRLERELNQISGVVCTGLFVQRHADRILVDASDSCMDYVPSDRPLW